jgi:plasmid stabilization system protein ParE
VEFSDRAVDDRDRIFLYLNSLSIEFARLWLEGLMSAIKDMADAPRHQPIASEADTIALPGQEIRRLLYFGPGGRKGRNRSAWRVLYLVIEPLPDEEEGILRVLRILHSSQDSGDSSGDTASIA